MAAPCCKLRLLGKACLLQVHHKILRNLPMTGVSSRWNSNRASIAKTNRKVHPRLFPTVVVNPDGSTYLIKYKEPRKILYLPFDVNSLSSDEKKARLTKYQVKRKQDIEDDLEDSSDVRRYKQFWKLKY